MAKDDVIVLGTGNLRRRDRQGARSVKTRYSVEVSGDSVLIDTDPKVLGAAPAAAIAKLLAQKVRNIGAVASAATIAGRARARKAFDAGASWAKRRYAGGKMGPMAPHQSDRLFNDSGRLEKSIAVGSNSEGWTVNVAANRFSPDTLNGGAGALTRIYQRLGELVPEFVRPELLLQSKEFRDALDEGFQTAIQIASEKNMILKQQLIKARMQLAQALVRLVA